MTLEEAQGQRPKLEQRLDGALALLAQLVRNLPGGDMAIREVKVSILALDVQRRLEIEIISHGTTSEADDETALINPHLDPAL